MHSDSGHHGVARRAAARTARATAGPGSRSLCWNRAAGAAAQARGRQPGAHPPGDTPAPAAARHERRSRARARHPADRARGPARRPAARAAARRSSRRCMPAARARRGKRPLGARERGRLLERGGHLEQDLLGPAEQAGVAQEERRHSPQGRTSTPSELSISALPNSVAPPSEAGRLRRRAWRRHEMRPAASSVGSARASAARATRRSR